MTTLPYPAPRPENESTTLDSFPIVGIGASAGGLEAVIALLRQLPPNPGLAVVLVQHLDPSHPSLLTEILARETSLTVTQATHDELVRPDHLYVIPPNHTLTIVNRRLQLGPREKPDGVFMPIDLFLRSLAIDCDRLAAAVVLSGGGSDGALGLQEVKANDGVTFVQDARTAKHSAMPRSAEATGCADFVLPPEQIAAELVRLKGCGIFAPTTIGETDQFGDETIVLPKIFQVLRQQTGTDFSQYKRPTIRRRISRRMALNNIHRLEDYVAFLQQRPEEQQALYQDFLIRVTRFFRDPAAFETLQSTVFPNMLWNRSPDDPVRIWVVGCSTGEEVYSLAIALLEVLGDMITAIPVKILATDINEAALEKARAGIYLDNITQDVSPDRLRRFFNPTNSHYQICKSVRDLCVFSTHNIIRDTPFANLDLISCRNLLIYLDLPLQKRVLPYFHYALKVGGALMLGTSETLGSSGDLFEVVDKDHRIYSKKPLPARVPIDFPVSDRSFLSLPGTVATTNDNPRTVDLRQEADRLLLSRVSPAAILVDEHLSVINFRGHTAPYLNPASGPASLELLKLLRSGLALELRVLLERARREKIPARADHIHLDDDSDPRTIAVDVLPIPPHGVPQGFLILFEGRPLATEVKSLTPADAPSAPATASAEPRVAQLERELTTLREYTQSILEENEATNEELRAANEEILSSNEELQSTNEELQTAKEEMQSTNEELATVNDELKHRNRELNLLNDDLLNLFGGLDIPVIIVSRDLRIRRFTPPAEALFNLIPGDVGRRISDLRPNIEIPDFPKMVADVIESLRTKECDVHDHRGRWYSLRIRPYITTENKINGAAIAFVDIDTMKRTAADLAISRDNAETIVETVWEPLVVLDQQLRVQRANAAFYRIFQLDRNNVEHKSLASLNGDAWNNPDLIAGLQRIIPRNSRLRDYELRADFPNLGRRTLQLNAHRIFWEGSGTQMILLAIEDITDLKQHIEQATLLAREQAARLVAEKQNRLKDEFLAMLAHELRTPLAPIRSSIHILQQHFQEDPLVDQVLDISERQIAHMSRLLDDLLDMARLTQGKIQLRRELVHLQAVLDRAIESSRHFIDSRGHTLQTEMTAEPIYLYADPARLEQIFRNLLNNAAKYTDFGGHIRIATESTADEVTIRVSDNGIGISATLLPHVFDLFTQADRSIDRSQGGLGIGLTLVKNLVTMHAGQIDAASEGEGKGSTFTVRLPRVQTNARPEAVREAPPKNLSKAGVRILVVDDNHDAAKTLTLLLRTVGHEVTTAYAADEALTLAAQNRYDVFLLDIGLPSMDGYELARTLRDKLKLTDALLVAVTGYGQADDHRKSSEAGFDLHLVKPINPTELFTLLERRAKPTGNQNEPQT